MPTADSPTLTGVHVLVTRPAHQAQRLCEMIEAAGGTAIRFPTIEIGAPQNPAALAAIVAQLSTFDLAVFVSPNAVARAFSEIGANRWPSTLTIACVGSGSARALVDHGIADALVPTRADSEGLLDLSALQNVRNKRVVIFRGEGGRELLGEKLRERGAEVVYAECYRRLKPQTDRGALTRRFLQQRIDIVTVTSADAMRNLHDMIEPPAAAVLARTPVIVVSERLRDVADELGPHGSIRIAENPSDEGIVEAIRAWRGSQKNL
jgi:uroporphyrinogen-III synthase